MKNKGITLIALVITVILLLILAGVAISLVIGENGILKNAQIAKNKYENKTEQERNILDKYDETVENVISMRENNINDSFNISQLSNFTLLDENYIYNGGASEYVLEETYPMVLIVASGIGNSSGSSAAYTNISVSDTTSELIDVLSNGQRSEYESSKYANSTSIAYMINPDEGTVISCEACYRGRYSVYAIGE